jgi:hypothetical protein
MPELEALEFLIGSWKGSALDQFGEKGLLETFAECTHEPSEKFVQIRGESRKDGKVLNRGVQFITYNPKSKKYVGKRIWSMGFIENGEGNWEDDNNTLVFQIKFDNEPDFFQGTSWKSFIKRYGENQIGTGLYTKGKGESEYRLYGETRLSRISK